MFTSHHVRTDFDDTQACVSEPRRRRFGPAAAEAMDVLEQVRLAEAADRTLLSLVGCVAAATLVLALASSLGV